MNASLVTADRATHLRILVVTILGCLTLVNLAAILAVTDSGGTAERPRAVVKAEALQRAANIGHSWKLPQPF